MRSLHTFALFFCGFGHVSRRVVSAAIWRSPEYIMQVIRSRNTIPEPFKKQAAYNLHYVNIALGTVFPGMSFCITGGAALCDASAA